jgi:hypothetical protein
VGEPGVGKVVVGAHAAASSEDEPRHPVAGREAIAREILAASAVRHHRLRSLPGRVQERAERPIRPQELAGLPDHGAERRLQVGRRERLRGHALEGLDLLEPLEGLRVEAGVPDRGGGGRGDGGGELDFLGGKLAPRPGHAGNDADRAGVEENGHEQDRPDALRLEPGAVPDPRVLEHVGHDERLLGLEHAPREPLAQAELLLELDVLAGGTRLGAEGQRARPLAAEPDADDVHAEPGLRDVGEALEHLPEIEGGGDEPARLGEDLELAGGGQVGFAR